MNTRTREAPVAQKIVRWIIEQGGWAQRVFATPYGHATVDILGCLDGRMLQFEVKAPGNKATPRQEATLARWARAGAIVGVVYSVDDVLRMLQRGGGGSVNALEALIAARELIAEPEHWTRRDWGRTDDGRAVMPRDPDASAWCVWGALRKVLPRGDTVIAAASKAICTTVGVDNPTVWNDASTHAEVLAGLDATIERLKVPA